MIARLLPRMRSIAAAALVALASLNLHPGAALATESGAERAVAQTLLIKSKYLFNGFQFASGEGKAVLIQNGRIAQIGPSSSIQPPAGARVIDIPNGTIMPGFIDMHTHHIVNNVPVVRMMEHGVTTARDLGGPLTPVDTLRAFKLRQIMSGPIITARGGYPMPVFPKSGVEVTGATAATAKVRELVTNGAKVIAVSLEPGGELGAPWMSHTPTTPPPWPMLTNAELSAIVAEAHRLNKRVVAYVGETAGVRRALDFGVDEWAHMPCDHVDHDLWDRITIKNVGIDGTLDTLVSCTFSAHNAGHAAEVGAKLFYGTDLGHVDIPHGVDAREIEHGAKPWTSTKPWAQAVALALASATGSAGRYLYAKRETDEPYLGSLVVGAPADVLVVDSVPFANIKGLEYPRLVVSGGYVVIQRIQGE